MFLIHISTNRSCLPRAKSGALPCATTKDAHEAASLHHGLAGTHATSVPIHQGVPPYIPRSWDRIICKVEYSGFGHYFGLGQVVLSEMVPEMGGC